MKNSDIISNPLPFYALSGAFLASPMKYNATFKIIIFCLFVLVLVCLYILSYRKYVQTSNEQNAKTGAAILCSCGIILGTWFLAAMLFNLPTLIHLIAACICVGIFTTEAFFSKKIFANNLTIRKGFNSLLFIQILLQALLVLR